MNLHVFSLCEHRAGAPSVDGLDTVRLEAAPPLSADVSGDTPMPRNWGDSVIEGGEVPVIVGTTGASLKELMARLGQSSTRAALIYQHATRDRDQAIAVVLGGLARKVGMATAVRPEEPREKA